MDFPTYQKEESIFNLRAVALDSILDLYSNFKIILYAKHAEPDQQSDLVLHCLPRSQENNGLN